MKTLLCATFLFACMIGFAQTDTAKKQIGTHNDIITDTTELKEVIFTKTEVEAEFPGGTEAWVQFLQQNLVYPKKAIRKNIQGQVTLQFIVSKDGSVTNIQAISGPEELRKSAIETLKKTPNWKPAMQNGRVVKAYKKQPIVYILTN